MATRTVRYRDYQIVISPPDDASGRWRALVWRPNLGPPIVLPTHTTEDNALRDARNAVDRELGGPAPAVAGEK